MTTWSIFDPAKNISHQFKYLLCLEDFDHYISLFVSPLILADSLQKPFSYKLFTWNNSGATAKLFLYYSRRSLF